MNSEFEITMRVTTKHTWMQPSHIIEEIFEWQRDATEPFMEIIGGSVRAEQTRKGDTE